LSSTLELSIRINADGRAAVSDIRRVRRELDQLDPPAQQATRSTQGLTSALGKLGPIASTIAGSMLAARFIETAANADKLRATLVTMTGSVANASQSWEALNAFARQTPYDLQQSVDGFNKLVALGLDPSIEAMRSYGNTASAMGKDLDQMVEAVADATTGEFERLKEFGIKASQEGDRVSLTFRGMTTEIGNNAEEIQGYLQNIGNTDFAGAMELQMDTLGGAMSNLGMEFDALLLSIGDAGLTDAMQAGFEGLGAALAEVTSYIETGTVPEELAAWSAAFDDVSRGVEQALEFIREIPNPMQEMYDLIPGIEGQANAWDQVTHNLGFVADALLDLPDNIKKLTYIAAAEIAAIQDYWSAGWGVVTSVTAATWETIRATVGSALGAIQSAVASAVAWIAEKLASLTGSMSDFAAKASDLPGVGDFADGLASGLDSLKAKLEGAAAGAKASAGDIAANTEALKANEAAAWGRVEAAGAEVAAAGERAQAGREQAAQMIAELDVGRELEKQLDQAIRDEAALEKASADVRVERQKGTAAAKENAAANEKAGKAAKGAAGGMKALEDAAAKARKELERQAGGIDSLIKEFLPLRAAQEDFNDSVKTAAAALQLGTISAEEYATILAGVEQKLAETSQEAKRSANGMLEAWDGGLDELGKTFESTFEDAIRNGELSLESFSDWAKDWLADLALQFARQTIKVNFAGDTSGVQGGLTGDPTTNIFQGGGLTGDPTTNILQTGLKGVQLFNGSGSLGTVASTFLSEGFAAGAATAGASVLGYGGVAAGTQAAMLASQTAAFGAAGSAATASAAASVAGSAATGISGAIGGAMTAIGAAMPIIGGVAMILSATGVLDGLFGGGKKNPRAGLSITNGQLGVAAHQDVDSATADSVLKAIAEVNEATLGIANDLGEAAIEARAAYTTGMRELNLQDAGPAIEQWAQELVDVMIAATLNDIQSDAESVGSAYAGLVSRLRESTDGDLEAFMAGLAQLDAVLAQTGTALTLISDGARAEIEEVSQVAEAWLSRAGSLDGLTQSINF
jgi:hypothetical protein